MECALVLHFCAGVFESCHCHGTKTYLNQQSFCVYKADSNCRDSQKIYLTLSQKVFRTADCFEKKKTVLTFRIWRWQTWKLQQTIVINVNNSEQEKVYIWMHKPDALECCFSTGDERFALFDTFVHTKERNKMSIIFWWLQFMVQLMLSLEQCHFMRCESFMQSNDVTCSRFSSRVQVLNRL